MANYLIDTHIYIWLDANPNKLKRQWQEILANPNNEIYLSMASLWEMQIKYQLGKLELSMPLANLVEDLKTSGLYQILPIQENHILQLQNLPTIHKDPFDRMLIAQAMTENLTLMTDDEKIIQYPINFIAN